MLVRVEEIYYMYVKPAKGLWGYADTSFQYATDHWNPELCELLLEAGLDPEAEDDFKR
jgi:hypothetical protein